MVQQLGAGHSHGIVVVKVAAKGPASNAGLREGDYVEAINGEPVTNIKDYQEKFSLLEPGTQVKLKILRENQESDVSATTAPPSPQLVAVVKAISYKSLPYYSKSVFQISPGSNTTTCNATTNGNINATARPDYSGGADISGTLNSNTTTNCNSTYQPPQQAELNWRTIYNYNVVEGGGFRFVTLCTASVRWSQCKYLIPGSTFAAEVEGNVMWITGYKNGDQKKPQRVKYDILEVAPVE